MKIVKINNYDLIKEFSKSCKEKGMNFDEDNEYYGIVNDNGKLISIASYKIMKNGQVRFKSNYTLPEERRKGYMYNLIKFIIEKNEFKDMKTYCLKSSVGIYARLGFNLSKVEKHKYFDTYIMELKKWK